tara:strand:+ start:38 stop:634 length:597 start_codon:yes stop_codon:yes gene_type:complete
MSTTTLDIPTVFKAVKAFFTFEAGIETKRNAKGIAVYKTNLRYTDCAASTTRLDKEQFAAVKFLALQAIADPATRKMATMSKADFFAEKKLLEGKELKAFQEFRAKATAMAGPYMKSLGDQLLKCEPESVQKKVATAKEKAATAKRAGKAKKETAKDGREKIIEQLANIASIMKADENPSYKVPELQKALETVRGILD